MRNRFEKDLEKLNNELILMGALIERSIADTKKALLDKNGELADNIIEREQEVNEKEREIEGLCLKLLLQQQPVASDLRLISTALKMITDMERIGDQSADIAEITKRLIDVQYIKKMVHIPQMADATIKMVNDSIDAFVAHDLEKANAVVKYDDVVDDLFDIVKRDLIELIRENAENGEQAVDLLMIAKYFERIGDHAVNVAEWVIFSITGRHAKDFVHDEPNAKEQSER